MKNKHLTPATRREQLIMASDRILLQVGVNDFTIDKVVAYLGIAKGTVYNYFNHKNDLLAEVSAKALSQMLNYFKLSERNSQEGLGKTKAIIMSCYHYRQDYEKYFELIVAMERPDFQTNVDTHKQASKGLQDFFSEHIRTQQEKGFIRKELNPLIANYLAWGSSMGIMQFVDAKKNFLENVERISQEELISTFADTIVRGMATELKK